MHLFLKLFRLWSVRFGMTDREQEKRELEEQLAKCRRLSREFTGGITAKNLKELKAELEQKLREIDQ
jgi:hypothetical protein